MRALRRKSRRGPARLALLAALAACATAKPKAEPVQTMVFPPVTIHAGSPADLALAQLNEDELLAKGKAAFASADYELAARSFDRGVDAFPEGHLHAEMAYDSGLAHLQLHQWSKALERFEPLANPAAGQGDALDAAMQAATCRYFLEDYEGAAKILSVVAARTDLPPEQRIGARVDLAVCEVEQGKLTEAEHDLRLSVQGWDRASDEERLPEEIAGKAEFFLGEIYRAYFSAVKLDPSSGDLDGLGKELEQKAEELLSAQGHYLRAIRSGSGHWATAAGFRIGSLYEEMYDALVSAPLPPKLDAEQQAIYREELRKRVRVLVTKAINVYDETLAAADRIGEDNPFVSQTKQSLARLKSLLLEPAAGGAPPAPPHPAAPGGAAEGAPAPRAAKAQPVPLSGQAKASSAPLPGDPAGVSP